MNTKSSALLWAGAVILCVLLGVVAHRAFHPSASPTDAAAPTRPAESTEPEPADRTPDSAPDSPSPAGSSPFFRTEEATRAIIREVSGLELPEGTGSFRADSFKIPPDRIRAFYEEFLASFGKQGYRRFKGARVWDGPMPQPSIPADLHQNAAINGDHGRMVQFSAEGFSYYLFFDFEDGDVILARYAWNRD